MKRDMAILETVIMVLLFALAAAVIVQVIATAYLESQQSKQLGLAAIALEDAAENEKCALASGEKMQAEKRCPNVDGGFTVIVKTYATNTEAGVVYDMTLDAVNTDGEVLASLTAAQYVGGAHE